MARLWHAAEGLIATWCSRSVKWRKRMGIEIANAIGLNRALSKQNLPKRPKALGNGGAASRHFATVHDFTM